MLTPIHRRRLLQVAAAGLTVRPALAQMGFDPATLPARDVRILQAALVLTDHYTGLMDGDWGPSTSGAFDAWKAGIGDVGPPTLDDLSALAIVFLLDDREADWTQDHIDDVDFAYALPRGVVAPDPARTNAARLVSPGGDLAVEVTVNRETVLATVHERVLSLHALPDESYRLRRDTLLVSTAERADGRQIYLRSMRSGAIWVSLRVEADPSQHPRLRVIASSMRTGTAPPLSLTPDGALDRRVRAAGF